MRMAVVIEPTAFLEARGLDDEGVAFPLADRVAVPGGLFGINRQRLLRVTLNRLPGTFRRHVSTGRHQTRPERAGSASELKPSGNRRDDRRRPLPALLIGFHSAANPPSFPPLIEENGNGRFTVLHSHRTFP